MKQNILKMHDRKNIGELEESIEQYLEEERGEGHDPEAIDSFENAIEQFLEEESVEKSQPGSSSVHVPAPRGNEDDKALANEHQRSNQPAAPPAPAKATRRSEGVIPPVVANLDAEVIKSVGDNDTYCDLYDMQNIVTGMDYELASGTENEIEAKEKALENLENDPDYYKKKNAEIAQGLTKDTEENEDQTTSNWPVGLNLDLGSGPARETGHVGIDLYPHDEGTLVHDLNMGIPAPDESARNVRLVNSLEYMGMEDPKPLLSEIQRVLMPGGQFVYEGPNEVYNYPTWSQDFPGLVLEQHEDNEDQVQKVEGQPWARQTFTRVAVPDAATANDAEPRIGISQYDMLPADALLSMDALGYEWSDATSSGRGNRVHGYPSQGALVEKEVEINPSPQNNTYALPLESRYPINDLDQANKALTEASGKAEETVVKNAVYAKYPELKKPEKLSPQNDECWSAMETLYKQGRLSQVIVDMKPNQVQKSHDENALKCQKVMKGKIAKIKKQDKKKQIAYCVVLEPDSVDAQEDFMTADDIEEAAHSYLTKSRVIGSEHGKPIDATPVESYIAPQDLEWSDGPYGPQVVKQGSWVLGIKVHDPKEWDKIENGEYQGVSVGGFGVRT